jgi:hypothetical protein
MVAMNSIPQQEVANGSGHIEFLLANPITLSSEVAKKPSPIEPSGNSAMLISGSSFLSIRLYATGRAINQNFISLL